jgi:hypothetical protein
MVSCFILKIRLNKKIITICDNVHFIELVDPIQEILCVWTNFGEECAAK